MKKLDPQSGSVDIRPEGQEIKLTKTFNRKISANFGNSIDVATTISKTVLVKSGEELEAESTKLFEQAKQLTMKDLENNRELIDGALLPREKQTW